MDFQRIKAIIILLIGVLFIVGVTYFATVKAIIPQKEEHLAQQAVAKQNLKKVIVAKDQISMGTKITDDMVEYKDVPQNNLMDNFMTVRDEVVGKTVKTNIYKNEQITSDRLDSNAELNDKNKEKFLTPEEIENEKELQTSHRLITIDIPKYNFVNGSVKKGSLVDILVEKGQGQYDVVLPKAVIRDLKEVQGSSNESSNKGDNVEIQPKRPLPQPILKGGEQENLLPSTAAHLTLKNNPALTETSDYRITIRVTEKEHKRVMHAMTYGKFMTREYVSESQPPSKITFYSPYEDMVSGDGTVLPKRPAANKAGNIASPANANTSNGTTTNTQPTGR